jgi:hypothetical protein
MTEKIIIDKSINVIEMLNNLKFKPVKIDLLILSIIHPFCLMYPIIIRFFGIFFNIPGSLYCRKFIKNVVERTWELGRISDECGAGLAGVGRRLRTTIPYS